MTKHKLILAIILILLPALVAACAGSGGPDETPDSAPAQTATPAAPSASSEVVQQQDTAQNSAAADTVSGEVTIAFDYQKQSGAASNQFAVWIEDLEGNLIKTLYATRYTASGGYKNRPDSIALWVEKSALASMSKSEIDAVSSATPKAGALSYTWDLADANGNTVAPGAYRFFVEGTLRWKNRVYYSGVIEVGAGPATVQAEAEFIYEAADKQPALLDDAPENSMIGPVTASFTPTK